MKQKKYTPIPLYTLLLLFMAGCNENEITQVESSEIRLGIEGLTQTTSRAAVDSWDDTPVNVAYLFAPSTEFTQSLTISVSNNSGERINTGLEYPLGGTTVSFVGYHPTATPNAIGEVMYDISAGNTDVMMSNRVSGSVSDPINQSLNFKHKLTRVSFIMQCKSGTSYPEPIYGVLTHSANADSPLRTVATLDLNTGDVSFKVPGNLFSGSMEGYSIPLSGMEPLVIDVMFQPHVPVVFTLASLTEVKNINIDSDSDPLGLWATLQSTGGEEGKQYTVRLTFSGEAILAQEITASAWQSAVRINSTIPTWW